MCMTLSGQQNISGKFGSYVNLKEYFTQKWEFAENLLTLRPSKI